jgi:predicted acetyltransferase
MEINEWANPRLGELTLVKPTLRLADEFQRLACEHLAEGDRRYEEAAHNVAAFIATCDAHEAGRSLPAGWVPQSTFWLVRNHEHMLGCSRLRHALTQFLSHQGGHIGYDIRPSERGKGYGNVLFALTLRQARKLGFAQVLVTADEANVASWKVIERNGGRREDGHFAGTNGPFRRYWVPT